MTASPSSIGTTDLVVFLPGITGTQLLRDGHEVWGPRGFVRAATTLGRSLRELALAPDVGDGPAPDGVTAGQPLRGFHGIPGIWTPSVGYGRVLDHLLTLGLTLDEDEPTAPPGQLVSFGYDWRLSNRQSARRLQARLEGDDAGPGALTRWRSSADDRADAQVIFVAHSMGGLVARWYIEQLGGHAHTRTLITLGTPHRGATKSLVELVNGAKRGIGPVKFDVTATARSMPSTYELLPGFACVRSAGSGLRHVRDVRLPQLDDRGDLVAAGTAFQDALLSWPDARELYDVVTVTGTDQPTITTAEITADGDGLQAFDTMLRGREETDERGDGTVPFLSARPKEMDGPPATLPVLPLAEGHGALPSHRSVWDTLKLHLRGSLPATLAPPGTSAPISMSVDTLHEAGAPVPVRLVDTERRALAVDLYDSEDRRLGGPHYAQTVRGSEPSHGLSEVMLPGLSPGGYIVRARGAADPTKPEPVTTTMMVW